MEGAIGNKRKGQLQRQGAPAADAALKWGIKLGVLSKMKLKNMDVFAKKTEIP